MRSRRRFLLMVMTCALALGACASSRSPQPSQTESPVIEAAQRQVASAARSQVDEFAAIAMQKAREHLQAARAAWNQGDRARAEQQAYVARRLAQIAMAKAEIGKARARAIQIQARRGALMRRSGG